MKSNLMSYDTKHNYILFRLFGHKVKFITKLNLKLKNFHLASIIIFIISFPSYIQLKRNKLHYKASSMGYNNERDRIFILQKFTKSKINFNQCSRIC